MQTGLRLLAGFTEPDSQDAELSVQNDNVGKAACTSVVRDNVTIH